MVASSKEDLEDFSIHKESNWVISVELDQKASSGVRLSKVLKFHFFESGK